MAPALVEHSAAKERNSVSKKYLDNLSCIPQLDIVLGDNFKRAGSPNILKSKFFSTSNLLQSNKKTQEKENKEFAQEMLHMTSSNRIPMVTSPVQKGSCMNTHTITSSCLNNKSISEETFSIRKEVSNDTQNTNSSIMTYPKESTLNESCTTEERAPQPVATLYSKQTKQKRHNVQSKLLDLNSSMSMLNFRLRRLQSNHLNSHVACHVSKSSGIKAFNEDIKSSKNDLTTSEDASFNSKSNIVTIEDISWSRIRNLFDIARTVVGDETEEEEDFGSRVKVPISRGKRRSDKPTPLPQVLHQWKQKRSKIGSQCSWLGMKIAELDKKIFNYYQIHKKLKSERQSSRFTNCESFEKCDLETDKGLEENEAIDPSIDDIIQNQGCSRVCPVSNVCLHKYIKKPILELKAKGHSCRCLPSISYCHLCSLCQQEGPSQRDLSNLTGRLDPSFHSSLSFDNDTSLSFVLEQTLRKQRINTKVTISKSTKKKKKLKQKVSPAVVYHHEKDIEKTRISSTGTVKQQHLKLKSERSKSHDLSRKRASIDSSSGRLKKFRKLSESYSGDSSKPSTPTNELISPLSQSLPSVGFFPSLKQKKKPSSSGDYDINNIVIPYSMAASTRVERIQYKEIPTPGWRNVDGELNQKDSQEEREFTDDEEYAERHSRCEVEERKRFTSYFQPTRRPRPNRDGTNSQPPSPVIFEEPYKSNLSTPADSPNSANGSTRYFTRTSNVSAFSEEERDSPWTSRQFPLTEAECKNIFAAGSLSSPVVSSYDTRTFTRSLVHIKQPPSLIPELPRSTTLPSPLSSPGTAVEPNSNWTVKLMTDPPADVVTYDTQRKGIVLKLAKK